MADLRETLPRVVADGKDDDESDEHEPVVVPIEDSIDLHPFQPREVGDVVREYLDAAWEKGFSEVRVIHGKGIGNLRRTVHAILQKHPAVESFALADGTRGSWGATIVRLRKRA